MYSHTMRSITGSDSNRAFGSQLGRGMISAGTGNDALSCIYASTIVCNNSLMTIGFFASVCVYNIQEYWLVYPLWRRRPAVGLNR